MAAVEYISDTEGIVKASWSNFPHYCIATYKLSERFPLPPSLCTWDLLGKEATMIMVCRIWTINHHPAGSDEDSAPETTSNTENWLDRKRNSDNPITSNDKWVVDDLRDMVWANIIEHPESHEHRVVCATSNVPTFIGPIQRSVRWTEQELMAVTAMETRWSKGHMRKYNRMCQICFHQVLNDAWPTI